MRNVDRLLIQYGHFGTTLWSIFSLHVAAVEVAKNQTAAIINNAKLINKVKGITASYSEYAAILANDVFFQAVCGEKEMCGSNQRDFSAYLTLYQPLNG